ncbi:MAG TPA: imidazole glycerol phosphate synthase subunit HisH [Candidatus Aphodovivens avistercoris]|nr:imidazole glycerol phosphate synthase subunit HisH [Candidatus Aphodovivens avistercoris]
MIAVVDYHKGNLLSVERGLAAAGAEVLVTDDAGAIARAEGIVLPGVGAFADASATMQELGQLEAVRARIAAGVPFLGICLGMHLLFEEGVEGAPDEDDEESSHNARGLAVLPGVVVKMPKLAVDGRPFKVPHVGWNTVVPPASGSFACPLFEGIPAGEYFYFTHSYIVPDGPFAVGMTAHSVAFPSAVQYGKRCFGVQFHPEKSSDAGAAVLRNFVRIVEGA